MNGSVMVGAFDTKEELMKTLEEDVYTQRGVWDLEKAQIIPVSESQVESWVAIVGGLYGERG